jgi:hypothetical protein
VAGVEETPLYVAVQGPTPAIPLDLVAGHCLDAVRLSIYGGRSVALAAIRPVLKHGEVKEGATVATLILLLPARLLFTFPFVVLVLAFRLGHGDASSRLDRVNPSFLISAISTPLRVSSPPFQARA